MDVYYLFLNVIKREPRRNKFQAEISARFVNVVYTFSVRLAILARYGEVRFQIRVKYKGTKWTK
jgi:hypothetical protein